MHNLALSTTDFSVKAVFAWLRKKCF